MITGRLSRRHAEISSHVAGHLVLQAMVCYRVEHSGLPGKDHDRLAAPSCGVEGTAKMLADARNIVAHESPSVRR
jgi:hypothetical protein